MTTDYRYQLSVTFVMLGRLASCAVGYKLTVLTCFIVQPSVRVYKEIRTCTLFINYSLHRRTKTNHHKSCTIRRFGGGLRWFALRPGHTATEKRETRKLSCNQKSAARRFYFSERENLDDFQDRQPTDFLPPRKILTNQREVQ